MSKRKTPPASVRLSRVPDLPSLVTAAATRLAGLVSARQALGGEPRLVLTGGTAGIALLERMRDAEAVDFSRIHVFFGDERDVPVTDPESNEGQARRALLDAVGVPGERIHGMGLGGGDLGAAARRYEGIIDEFAPDGFDVHLLGMGAEGHVNSLFPESAATAEKKRLVVPVTDSPKPPARRLSLTLPAIARADRVWLLVSGAEKAEAARYAALAGPEHARTWPVTGARGRRETRLFLTEDAAGRLDEWEADNAG